MALIYNDKSSSDLFGNFSLNFNVTSENKVSVMVNPRSFILKTFKPNDIVKISGEPTFEVKSGLRIWLEIFLDNSSGEVRSSLKSAISSWWSSYPNPYIKQTSLSDGKFQGQTYAFAPVAQIFEKSAGKGDILIYSTDGKTLLYEAARYIRQTLMLVQFCDTYVPLPIGIAVID